MCVFIVLQECVFAGQLKPGKHNNRVAGGRGWWNSRRAPVALVNGNQRKSSIEHRTRIGNQQLLMVHGEGGGEQFRGRYGAPEYGDAAHN